MLLLAVFLAAQTPVDSVALVTRDIPNFWRAYDLAAGKDGAERTRIFRTVYLQPGSPGLRDWTRVRLMNRDTVRARTLALDTNSAIRQGIRQGLAKLAELYPAAHFPNIYFLIGTLSTGGTTSRTGMLIGTEQSASGPDTPLDELPAWAQKGFPTHRFESLVGLVVHEAVHTQQQSMPPGQHDTLLRHALGEGIADFLSELAVGPWAANTPRQIYGRAHEHDVWVDFQDEMEIASDSIIRTWMYNGMLAPDKNHGAVDIGYWVGSRIAGAYYARAADKRAAVRELLELHDPVAVLRESGYAP